MKVWLQLIRWPNLLLVGLAQVLFKYAFLPAFDIPPLLSDSDFIFLVISVVCITASGNIINDIYDVGADFINQRPRPISEGSISIKKAYSIFFVLNLVALLIARYLGIKYEIIDIVGIELLVIVLLYFYAIYLKSIPLFGNLLISALVSLSFLLVIYIELFANSEIQISTELIHWIIGYAGFAFWANLNREWIKDVQDIKGDYAQNISTLPILTGKTRMNKLLFMSTLLLIFSLIAGVKVYFQPDLIFILYLTFGICVPLVYVLFHIHRKELNTNYKMLSHIYKLVMLTGVMSLILFKL